MRTLCVLTILLGAAGLARTQEGKPKDKGEPPPRFGVPSRLKAYPQATPKQALESVVGAIEKGEVPYLLAHLLDPAFVESRVADRAVQFEPVVQSELITLREFQKKNPDRVSAASRVPDDAEGFRAMVTAQARDRAFRQFVRDVQDKLSDDPENLKDLRRFLRAGTFNESGDAARVGLPDVKDRAVYIKKIGERWFVEDRQTEEKAPEPKKN
jgi:hypothetical protein